MVPFSDHDVSFANIQNEESDSVRPHEDTSVPSTCVNVTSAGECPTAYKIVGDNVDKNVAPRYIRTDSKVKSLHYYHSYAVQDRINIDSLSDVQPLSCIPSPEAVAKSLLPSSNDDALLVQNIKILFSRVLVETLPSFNVSFSDLVTRHIQHRRYAEMSSKSLVVSNICKCTLLLIIYIIDSTRSIAQK